MSLETKMLTPNAITDLAADAARAAAGVFRANDWRWGDPEYSRVPDAPQIAATLAALLVECKLDHSVSTGRFHVTRFMQDGREVAQVELTLGDAVAKDGS